MSIVAIDASRAIRRHKTGVEWYAWHLIRALAAVAPSDWHVRLIADRSLSEIADLLRTTDDARRTNNWSETVLRWPPLYLWTQLRLAAHLQRTRPDIFFSPVHVLPFGTTTPAVVTIHDVDYSVFPEGFSPQTRAYLSLTTAFAVRRATRILTPSEYSKQHLIERFGCDPEKIRVTPLAPMIEGGAGLQMAPNPAGLPERYFLFVGRLERKKNIGRIVSAFRALREKEPDLHLVLVGRPGYGYEEAASDIEKLRAEGAVHLLGWKSREELVAIWRGAIALLFPSQAEGFGLPVLDAFSLGTPVVTSRGIATEEVAGDAALLVDPSSVEELTETMRLLAHDPALRETYIARGRSRVANFSWEKTARLTAGVFQEILSK